MSTFIGLIGILGLLVCFIILIVKAIRKKPQKAVLISMMCCFAVFVIGIATMPNSNNTITTESFLQNKNTNTPIITMGNNKPNVSSPTPIPAPENAKGALKDSVVLLEPTEIVQDTFRCYVIGANFDKASGDSGQDAVYVGNGLNETFDDGLSKGMDIGFYNAADAKIENMDAYLSLYVQFVPDASITSQRDSFIPEMKMSAEDDQGDALRLIHYSHKDQYVNLEYPYGLILFKGYYDATQIDVIIDKTIFTINLSDLK